MKTATERAPGKLNLTLDVCGRRPDGYHEMQMVMQSVALCDLVTVRLGTGKPWSVRTDAPALPDGPENLAWKAAAAFERAFGSLGGVQILIEKHLPAQAGMAGGSSDAAAVLRALNRLCGFPFSQRALAKLGEQVGSDVPYCVHGGTMLAEGRGEVLTALPQIPDCWALLCKPAFSISTPELFRELDGCAVRRRPDNAAMRQALQDGDLERIGRLLYNVFEPVVRAQYPVVGQITGAMRELGALGTALTGTGSVVYGIFSTQAHAAAAQAGMSPAFGRCIVTKMEGTIAPA